MTARLRPFLPTDAVGLADVFRTSIEILAEDDYSDAQREAWAALADDHDDFAKWLGGMLTLVVESEEGLVGFAALEDNTMIALLYVRPDFARRGVATLIVRCAGKARGGARHDADHHGRQRHLAAVLRKARLSPTQRNTVMRNGEWLANTTMQKTLAPLPGQGESLMSKERLYLFDTTLRDGAQTTGVDFSLADKRTVAAMLDKLGVDYIEGGYPGANPVDTAFFNDPPKTPPSPASA
jgi:putative acetyltransferase